MDLGALNARLADPAVAPGDEAWDRARQAWNLVVDQRPAAVAEPASVDEVIAIVEFARANGLRVAPQGTGHNAGPLQPLDDTILLRTSRMRRLTIDPTARRARVEAGVEWIEVTNAAGEHGLAALAGSSPDVGVVGYSLGGGVGWLARRYGLASNSVLAADVVTADGRLVRADPEHEPDLFWALRGGGGSVGIVTALEFALYPVATVYAGVLFWPVERAAEILHAWRDWVATVPDEVTSVGRLFNFPPIPEMPEPLRGRSFVVVEAAYIGSEADGVELLRPLAALGPEMNTFATIPTSTLHALHMDPPYPVPGAVDGKLLADFPAAAVDALVASAGAGPASSLMSVELRHLGGALATRSSEHGALDAIEAGFALITIGIVMAPEMAHAVEHAAGVVLAALEPWDAGNRYLNFTEHTVDTSVFFPTETYRRLRRVKARYDPHDLIRSNHPILPAG